MPFLRMRWLLLLCSWGLAEVCSICAEPSFFSLSFSTASRISFLLGRFMLSTVLLSRPRLLEGELVIGRVGALQVRLHPLAHSANLIGMEWFNAAVRDLLFVKGMDL